MTKVLVFESDAEFAQSLSSGLSAYGCETKIVEDGEEGIAAAGADKPDLILLTIELPRMNGFSVCNKLKRNGDLKSVPLVLLSSEATEETFEQHKRLRTRADEYVHKPVTVDELVAKLGSLVSLEKSGASDGGQVSSQAETGTEIEEFEEVELEGEDLQSTAAGSRDDSGVAEETDQAFGNLMAPEEPAPPPDEIEMDELVLEEDDGLEVAEEDAPISDSMEAAPVSRSVPPPSAHDSAAEELLKQEIAALRGKVEQLEGEVKSARDAAESEADAKTQVSHKKDAEIELIQREVDELKKKLSSNEGAGTAREFLDLREQLNKKDKEIIDVRDQLTSKERELVRANDETISLGREKADLTDRITALETSSAELTRTRDALAQDKEQATKRGDDFKARSERLDADLTEKSQKLKAEIESHENTVAARDAQEAALRDDHKKALAQAALDAEAAQQLAVDAAIHEAEERAAEAQEAALVAAAEEAKRQRDEAVSVREGEMKAEQDSKMAALHRANEESLRKLRAEHEQASEEAAQAAAERLAERERELGEEKASALSLQKEEDEAALAALRAETDQQLQERNDRIASLENDLAARMRERDESRATVRTRDEKIEELEAALASQRAETVELRDKWETEAALLSRAREKWQEDSAGLSSAQQALAAAASELEKALSREMP